MLLMPVAAEFLSCLMIRDISSILANISVVKWELLFATLYVSVLFVFGEVTDF